MTLDGGTLYAAGSGQSGQQAKGKAAQYQLAGTKGLASTAITGYDSGTIVAVHSPGKAPSKLVNGTIQNAASIVCNNLPLGNTLPTTNQPTTLGGPIANPGQSTDAGLSNNPEHE